ncbi:hypothetical protein ACIP88_25155 [Streptomyces uncialis]|uniref:hypothetical protein n=1 Tax=Streptomyces uncialis TaxID=1048205 RepID=UPI0037F2ACDE
MGRFEATLVAAVANWYVLPYDKDRRWDLEKQEAVVLNDVVLHPDHALIPAMLTRGRGTVKVSAHGHRDDTLDEAAELPGELATVHGAASAQSSRTCLLCLGLVSRTSDQLLLPTVPNHTPDSTMIDHLDTWNTGSRP